MTTTFGQRTGTVWISDFERGIITTMGGIVQADPLTKQNKYYTTIPGTNPTLVPIVFDNPEQMFTDDILPMFLITRESVVQNLARWQSIDSLEYSVGVSGTEMVVGKVSGYGQYERKPQAWPFDINYRISCYARFEREALSMVRFILRTFQVNGRVAILDSLNETRYYSTYLESVFQDISDIVDVSSRSKAYSISLRVEGEIDLYDPYIVDTVSGFVMNSKKG